MGFNSIPNRWEEYSNVGKLIPGTKVIPFKVPLREEICRNLSNSRLRFTVNDLFAELGDKKLSMIIDLTQTKRFYNEKDLEPFHVKYVKLATRGGGCMPSDYEVKKFCDIIDSHLKDNPEALVGVHCTHGLNRTGYFICRYMIDCLGFVGSMSVKLFEESRGHRFDRENYRSFLIGKSSHNDDQSLSWRKKKSPEYNSSPREYQRTENQSLSWRKKKPSEHNSSPREYKPDYQIKTKTNDFYENRRICSTSDDNNYHDYRSYIQSNRYHSNSDRNEHKYQSSGNHNSYMSYRLSKENSANYDENDRQENKRNNNNSSPYSRRFTHVNHRGGNFDSRKSNSFRGRERSRSNNNYYPDDK